MGETWVMRLPQGVADPIGLYELAEHLHMSVAELCHGRGALMSAHELTVGWPLYFEAKQKIAKFNEGRER